MPVTAKLSKELYDRLGERVADELVDWFNSVDIAYRSDLREFNEINFQRFDDKLERRLAQFGAALEARLEARLNAFEVALEAKLEAKLDVKLQALEARLEARFEHRFADLLKWSFVFWIGTIGTVVLTAKFIP